MKTNKLIALVAMLGSVAYSTNAYALKTTPTANTLKIQFENSESFRDIDQNYGRGDRASQRVLSTVQDAFQSAASKYLPDGYTLDVKVTDIDLAGDRSMLTSTNGDIRVYRDIFPPRISFSYAIFDPSEQLVASGSASETDLNYTFNFRGARQLSDDNAPYVTELVRGWASKELRRAVNAQ